MEGITSDNPTESKRPTKWSSWHETNAKVVLNADDAADWCGRLLIVAQRGVRIEPMRLGSEYMTPKGMAGCLRRRPAEIHVACMQSVGAAR
jgi:hypothetical protein